MEKSLRKKVRDTRHMQDQGKTMCEQEGGAMLRVGKVELVIKSTREYKEIHHMTQGIFDRENIWS